jgi:peptidoglycan hydrolase-like protein with peptidoglycan-binding domain
VSAAVQAPATEPAGPAGGSEQPGASRRGGRLRRRAGRAAAGVLVVAAIGGAVWLLWPDGEHGSAAVNDAVPLGTATAERRDLVDHQDIDGTLGYTGDRTVSAGAAGTVTRLRPEGSIVRRGQSLLSIDAVATGWVLYGRRPMYRDLGPGVADGRDVRQLERNLKALGYDPGTVDVDWTSATTAAVQEFQEDRDLTETGTLARADVVVADGRVRVGAHKLAVGDAARAGAPVTGVTSLVPLVTARVDVAYATTLRRGDRVEVALGDGRSVRGRIAKVGTVATAGEEGASPTIGLRVAVRAGKGARGLGLDGAPVSIALETGRTRDVLAVPVTALVATAPGRYAVELAGTRRLVAVELGTSAGGWVEVEPARGAALGEGTRVVVPR